MLSKQVLVQDSEIFTGFEEKKSSECQQCGQSDVNMILPVGTEGQKKWPQINSIYKQVQTEIYINIFCSTKTRL